MNDSLKILITGASGFIGTNLLKHFLNKGFLVANIDQVLPKNIEDRIYWFEVDINNFENLHKVALDYDPDYIVHLAARTDLDGSCIGDYDSNTVGVRNLMRIVPELCHLKKIVIASSMLVCHAGYYPKNQFDYSPTTIYGESKVETEKIVWANKPHCDWAIIRPTSIWGPWFGIPYKNFFDMIIARKYFHIGTRGCTKTYGYVGNAVYQIEQILFSETLDETKKIFFIGDDPATNIEEWGNEIAAELGHKIVRMPFGVIKCVALFGDFLKSLGLKFPMTSFRLKNMMTDNLIDLGNTRKIAPNPPFSRMDGVKETLHWINMNAITKI